MMPACIKFKPLINPRMFNDGSNYFLRLPLQNKIDEKLKTIIENKTEKKESDEDEFFLCGQCLQIITSTVERVKINEKHLHTFANPHGIIYEIGCFKTAIGCGYTGPVTAEWSWFDGFSWKIALCSKCLIHLGWFFISNANESFNGLIINRLILPK